MATSEHLLSALASESPSVDRSSNLNAWRYPCHVCFQMAADAITICLVLSLVSASSLVPHAIYEHGASPWIAIALMMTTIFGFSGAYPAFASPLSIASTTGLVRGASCIGVLLSIRGLFIPTTPSHYLWIILALVCSALCMERELGHVISRHRFVKAGDDEISDTCDVTFVDSDNWEHDWRHHVSSSSIFIKRVFDIVGAGMLIVLASPFVLLIAAAIKLDSRGPVLLRQRRVGKNGLPFDMWKFRSMRQTLIQYERSPTNDHDPRLTRVGRVLRRLSLDEIPQLLNVLSGDMSLVGPRPEMPFIVDGYRSHERLRLIATPGITGLWQISPARAMPIHHNLQFDLYYIEHRNVFLDVAILLRTVSAVIRGMGAA